MKQPAFDVSAIRARLAETHGRFYWRSLEELAESTTFQDFLQREFPRQASEWLPTLSRRGFLKLMAASLALAGLTGCSAPDEKIVPYVASPEESVPGKPLFFATAMQLGGYALGLLAQSYENRPTKLEGNPDHPASLGATDAFAQASILTLYDPDRAKEVTNEGEASDWERFLQALQPRLVEQRASGGTGLRILSETVTSPTLFAQLQAVLKAFPKAVWHQYEPVNRDNVYAGATLAFDQVVEPVYQIDKADVLLCLDADLFQESPGRVRYARDFADGRRGEPVNAIANTSANTNDTQLSANRKRNRLYVVESTPTITGAMADHRLPQEASQIESVARAVAKAIGLELAQGDTATIPSQWIAVLARDLQANAGSCLVVAGDQQPPSVHAIVHAINEKLGNVGQTVVYTEPVIANPIQQLKSLAELTDAMKSDKVQTLLILGSNPVFTAPVDFDFGTALEKVPFRVHLGLYTDETAAQCHWQISESHYLEAWSDGRAYDGTITIQQPLIAPLYASHSAHELLDALLVDLASTPPRSDHEIVKAYWREQQASQPQPTQDFENFWQQTLHDGFVAKSARPAKQVKLLPAVTQLPALILDTEGLELYFRPDPTIWDGRAANNGWLQELPKPLTKLTWENAALINPVTAERLQLSNGDLVELDYGGRTVQAPILLLPGHCEGAVTVYLGYGRTQAGRVGNGAGFNAYALRTSNALWFGSGLALTKVSSGYTLALTQDHHSMEGRNLIRNGTVAQFEENPEFVREMDAEHEASGNEISLYPKFEYNENAWGMTIDLNACNGCNACVVACQAENNIPIVGKEQVSLGREMHWLRIDSYYEGDLFNPQTHHQPVMCMHCENAPCEVVCPVAATMHDAEGLNVMVYNRCIGTRYCSNNCPYKVRRFNFLEFTDYDEESLKLQRNPNVTVRARGVMEKCTYCTQRISAARIQAKLEGRPIQEGEVVTACQAACPTKAITFGNLNDPNSEVAKQKASPLNYGLLSELNTHPRTTYLAKLRNPNPEME